jgi:hypothetical protein
MKDCPPKPGLTLIIRMMSIWSSTYLQCSRLLEGVSTRPDLQPRDRIRDSERCTWLDASGWKVIYDAPIKGRKTGRGKGRKGSVGRDML